MSQLSLLLLKYKESISDESFVCLDYVDLGFDDIMREESAGLTMSEAGSGHYPEAEEAMLCHEEGDIISDIERIQRALAGDIDKLKHAARYNAVIHFRSEQYRDRSRI